MDCRYRHMPDRTQHVVQPPGGPSSLAAVAAPGGCAIYCSKTLVSTAGTGGGFSVEGVLEFPISSRSTINIQISYSIGGGGSYSCVWNVTKPVGAVGLYVLSPAVVGTDNNRVMTTAITRDPGTIRVEAFASSLSSGASGWIMIVAIVGSNTEDDCVDYFLGA